MTSIQFTQDDRDEHGFVKAPARNPEPRSLADLLPTIAEPHDQTIRRTPATQTEQIAVVVLFALLTGLLIYLWSSAPQRPAAQREPPTVPQAPPSTPTSAPTSVPVVMLPAYSAPNVALGQIQATRVITPVAHYGDGWIQADVQGSGRIWLRASDWPSLALIGTDLAPQRPAAVAPAPYMPPAEPPPVPPRCAEVGIPGQMVSVCGDGDLEALAKAKWIATYGGNIGTVGHPTPQIKDTQ